jgi:hypothetical protein
MNCGSTMPSRSRAACLAEISAVVSTIPIAPTHGTPWISSAAIAGCTRTDANPNDAIAAIAAREPATFHHCQ